MNPGELERKYERLQEEHAELEKELALYKEFFEASLAMNISAAGLPSAARVQRALREVETVRIRKGIPSDNDSALSSLRNISKEKV